MATIKIGTTQYYYELHGRGQALVLVTGYSVDSRKWAPILDDLSKKFQVLIFDNRGIGRTKDGGEQLNAELMAGDTMALIEALGLENPCVAGHSMGGTIVQAMAIRYSDKINKIAIMQSSAKWRMAMLNGLKGILLMRKDNASFDAQFASILAWVFGEKFLQNTSKVEELKNMILTDSYLQSIIDQERQFRVLENFDAHSFLKEINTPTLVISGVEDILSLPHEAVYLADNIKNAKLVSLECGHDAITEMPKELSQALITFMQNT